MTKKIISIIMCLTLTILCIFPSFSAMDNNVQTNEEKEYIQTEYKNKFNKLHFYFESEAAKEFNYIDSEKELDKAIKAIKDYYNESFDSDEPIYFSVEFMSGYLTSPEYLAFSKERENIKTHEEKDNFRRRLVAFSGEYHGKENLESREYLKQLGIDSVAFTDYAPFAEFEISREALTSEFLMNFVDNERVANVAAHEKVKVENQSTTWNRTIREIGAYSTISSGLYTGEGIKIGVFEAAVCDTSHSNFNGKTIHIRPGYGNDSNTGSDKIDHATVVTSIIAKMAPDAEFYVSKTAGNPCDLSWFISNGCDIVNGSFSCATDDAYHFYLDGLIDYQIQSSFTTCIFAAGNIEKQPDGYINSPALANDAVTVGGLSCTWALSGYKLEYDSGACYRTTDNRTKPEVSALFDIYPPGYLTKKSGTSVAAPQVTGCAALIMCKYVHGDLYPHTIKALLVSGATKTENYTNMPNTCFDEKVGAGCVNLLNMRNNERILYTGGDRDSENIYVNSTYVTLNKNDTLQVGLSWFNGTQQFENSPGYYYPYSVADFDIIIKDPSDNTVCVSSYYRLNNCEFVRYKAPSAGTYRIRIYMNGTVVGGDAYSLFSLVHNIL